MIGVGIDLFTAFGDKVDALALQVRTDIEGDRGAITPAHGDPGIGRYELEVVPLVDNGDLVLLAQFFAQLIGCGHAAGAGAENNYVCH